MLELCHVSVSFVSSSHVLAVDDVSMEFPKGSRTAIVGETGSGKSVLLLAILRLLPREAQIQGSIRLNGEELLLASQKRMHQIRGGEISYIPQGGGASMNPLMKIAYQVGEPLTEHREYRKKQAIQAGTELLERFHLPGTAAKAFPHMFSGGMRQRAMVAMGIAAGAGIVMADEPTKGLDEKRIELVAEAFRILTAETLICVTHDMNFAKEIGHTICVMYAAQQVELGAVEEVWENPLHPYTRAMLQAMPENGMQCVDFGFMPSHDSYTGKDTGCRFRARCEEQMPCCEDAPPVTDINGHKVRCWKYVSRNKRFDKTIRENEDTSC